MKTKPLVFSMAILCSATSWAGEYPSPYVGQETREIKALSPAEIQSYLAGEGMALAKAAELNHYPGPRHVLDMADALQLSSAQRSQTETIFNKMKAAAVDLGKQMVEKERLLDSRFAAATITDAELQQLLAEIGRLQGEIRTTHLQAHLSQRQILTPEQVKRYDDLRGYGAAKENLHGGH